MLLQSAPHTLANKLLRMISPPQERSDRELLTGFVSHRDEDAFAELVRRHGRMVLAVTRRVTGHSQDAEDAFQAAFLVLARRAGQIERPELLANWLYGVAYHTAREARASRRRVLEQSVASLPETLASSPPEHNDELGRVIDEEVAALPDKYRCAVVLCDLQGLSRATAARQMKIPEGTLSSRLAYARKLLAAKLTRRGITSTSGGILALLGGEVTGVVLPREMVILTARVAAQTRVGGLLPPELVSPTVSHLTEGVLKMMFVNRWQLTLTTACMTCGLLALGAYGLAQMPAQKPGQSHPPGTATNKALNTAEKEQTPKYVPRGIEDDDVPYASVPTQAVVRLENGKLIIRQRVYYFEPVSEKRGNETVSSYQLRSAVSGATIPDIADINVFDMKGNRLMPKTWKERLKVDVHVLIMQEGKLPNPRELALFKEDTLILVLSIPLSNAPTPPLPPSTGADQALPPTAAPPVVKAPAPGATTPSQPATPPQPKPPFPPASYFKGGVTPPIPETQEYPQSPPRGGLPPSVPESSPQQVQSEKTVPLIGERVAPSPPQPDITGPPPVGPAPTNQTPPQPPVPGQGTSKSESF